MKRLFIAISCTLLLFASKASASKSRCPMQHADSIIVFGVMPGYAQEAGKYTDITFYLPHNLAQRLQEKQGFDFCILPRG